MRTCDCVETFHHFHVTMRPLAFFIYLVNHRDGGNTTMISTIQFPRNVMKSIHACTSLRVIRNVSGRKFRKAFFAKHM
jgi:hypothetical protein